MWEAQLVGWARDGVQTLDCTGNPIPDMTLRLDNFRGSRPGGQALDKCVQAGVANWYFIRGEWASAHRVNQIRPVTKDLARN